MENEAIYVKYIAPEFSSYQSANVVENVFFNLYDDSAYEGKERVIILDFVGRNTRGELIANPVNVTVTSISNTLGGASYAITKKVTQMPVWIIR